MLDYLFIILIVFRFCVLLSNLSGSHKILILLLSAFIPTVIETSSINDITQLNVNQRLFIMSIIGKIIFYFMLVFISYEDKILSKKQIYILLFFIFLRFINTTIFLVEKIEHKKITPVIPDLFIPVFLFFTFTNYIKPNYFKVNK
jgi:hypothetical protein